jgi:hypothetical protein
MVGWHVLVGLKSGRILGWVKVGAAQPAHAPSNFVLSRPIIPTKKLSLLPSFLMRRDN